MTENVSASVTDRRKTVINEYKKETQGKTDLELSVMAGEDRKEAGGYIKASETIRDSVSEEKKYDINTHISIDNLLIRFLETDQIKRVKVMNKGATELISNLYLYKAEKDLKNFAVVAERMYLAPIIFKLIIVEKYLSFNNEKSKDYSDFEKDYIQLYNASSEYSNRMDFALRTTAEAGKFDNLDWEAIKKRLDYIKSLEVLKNAKHYIAPSEKNRVEAMSGKKSTHDKSEIDSFLKILLDNKFETIRGHLQVSVQDILHELINFNKPGDSESGINIDTEELTYLAPVILKLIAKQDNYVQINKIDDKKMTELEEDLMMLQKVNPDYANRLINALKKIIGRDPLNITEDEFSLRVETIKELIDSKGDKEDLDMNRMLKPFQEDPAERRLITALFSKKQEDFWKYVEQIIIGTEPANENRAILPDMARQILDERIKRQYLDQNKQPPSIEEQVNILNDIKGQLLSDEIMNRCRKLMGKIYSVIDKVGPDKSSSEAMQMGNYLENTKFLIDTYEKRFAVIMNYKMPTTGVFKDISFWRKKQHEITSWVDVTSSEKIDPSDTVYQTDPNTGRVKRKEKYRILKPGLEYEKVENEYMLVTYILNSVRSEKQQREIYHDLRAAPKQSSSQETFWRRMYNTMSRYTSTDIDTFHELYDQETIFLASKIWDKLTELNFARNNWINGPLVDRVDPGTGRTEIDDKTIKYVIRLFGKNDANGKLLNEDELMRAINLGIAFNYGPMLKAFTTPGCADAGLDVTGKPDMKSFGQSDSDLYFAFNPQSYKQHRWSSQSMQEAGMIETVLMSDVLENIYKNWDFRTLQQIQIPERKRSFVIGKNQTDYDNHQVRYSDIINIARVGSIYESGWRKTVSYEGWFVPNDIKKTIVAMENIGISVLKNFLLEDIEKVDSKFYRDGSEEKRRDLVKFLYKKYLKPVDQEITEAEIDNNVNEIFTELEKKGPDLKKREGNFAPMTKINGNYQNFFYNVTTHEIARRMPTKFLRLESQRRRKIPTSRETPLMAVFDLAKNDLDKEGFITENELNNLKKRASGFSEADYNKLLLDEAYYQAVEDVLFFGETLNRQQIALKIKDEMNYNGNRLEECANDFELSPEKLVEIWKKEEETTQKNIFSDNEAVNNARKKNALAVLVANRKYIFNPEKMNKSKFTYLENFAYRWAQMPAIEAPFDITLDDLDPSLLAHSAQGEKSNARMFGDIADAEKNTLEGMTEFYSFLRKESKNPKNDYDGIVDQIKKLKSQISNMHGTEYANEFASYLAIKAISYFLINSESEGFLGWMKSVGSPRSLSANMGSAFPGQVWEWSRINVYEFIEALSKAEVIPFNPFKTQGSPKMEEMYELDTKEPNKFKIVEKISTDTTTGETKIVKEMNRRKKKGANWDRRQEDFANSATKLMNNFIHLPIKHELLRSVMPTALVLFIIWLFYNIYGGYSGKGLK